MLTETRMFFRTRTQRSASAASAGFTLIEMLVVVLVLSLLAALIVPALSSARKRRFIVLAAAEVKTIAAAAEQYFQALHCYPPDTDMFTTGANPELIKPDPDSIFKYLGREITEQNSKAKYGPFMLCKTTYLGGTTMESYMDPWGKPYHMDCVHSSMDPRTGDVTVRGEPYPPASSPADKALCVLDVKVWSSGPDGEERDGSASFSGRNEAAGDVNKDNICSWELN
ncbi:MAG TPA: prepilin-type N-terminal cleavage/methylation domain-containing protein [Planctomycetota bacterium]|jgi:prepilin-type N-terminal cleavage/methylation domain-containing protein